MPNPSHLYFENHDAVGQEEVLVGIALGEHWTRRGVLSQVQYLGEYTKDPQLQSAWLLACAACLANDGTTPIKMKMALDEGLSVREACRAALHLNSKEGARALSSLGVDWSSQKIHAEQRRFSGDHDSLSQPTPVFMECAMNPDRGNQRFFTTAQLESVVEVAIRHGKTDFVEGMIAEEKAPAEMLVDTLAMGMRSGKVSVLSLAIIEGRWPLVEQLLSEGLPQDILDEALFAVAMRSHLSVDDEDKSKEDALALRLLSAGASPDRPHHQIARAYSIVGSLLLPGEEPDRSGHSTARQWAIAGALLQDDKLSPAFKTVFLENIPRLPGVGEDASADHPTWWEWAFMAELASSESAQVEVLSLLANAEQQRPESIKAALGQSASLLKHHMSDGWGRLTVLMETAPKGLLKGLLSRDEFVKIIEAIGGKDPCSGSVLRGLWVSPTLGFLERMLSLEDATIWKDASGEFLKIARLSKAANKKGSLFDDGSEREALSLAYHSMMHLFEGKRPAAPLRARRSL